MQTLEFFESLRENEIVTPSKERWDEESTTSITYLDKPKEEINLVVK